MPGLWSRGVHTGGHSPNSVYKRVIFVFSRFQRRMLAAFDTPACLIVLISVSCLIQHTGGQEIGPSFGGEQYPSPN